MSSWAWNVIDFFVDELPEWLRRHDRVRLLLVLSLLLVPAVRDLFVYLLTVWAVHRAHEVEQLVLSLLPELPHSPAVAPAGG